MPSHTAHLRRYAAPSGTASRSVLLLPQVVASFLALLGRAAGGADPAALAAGDWASVPGTLPTIALAFVYQNVVPVIASSLEARRMAFQMTLQRTSFQLDRSSVRHAFDANAGKGRVLARLCGRI